MQALAQAFAPLCSSHGGALLRLARLAAPSLACGRSAGGQQACFSAQPQAAVDSQPEPGLIEPHGGELVDLMVQDAEQRQELIASCKHKQECTDRNACDVELLTVGGFSPLTGFLDRTAYDSVVDTMRLPGQGLLLGLPVVMDTSSKAIQEGDRVLLTYRGQNIGVLDVTSKWEPNKAKETKLCYGTSSLEHPGVQMVAWERGRYYIGGPVHGLELPRRVFPCATPEEVRASLPRHADVVAFQCRNPVHRWAGQQGGRWHTLQLQQLTQP